MNIPIVGTEWTVTEILPISILSGELKTGAVSVSHSGSEPRKRFNWRANRHDGRWHIMGEGAMMPSGERVRDVSTLPFMRDPFFNRGLSTILAHWLNEQLGMKDAAPKLIAPSAPQPSSANTSARADQQLPAPAPPVPIAPPRVSISWRPGVSVGGESPTAIASVGLPVQSELESVDAETQNTASSVTTNQPETATEAHPTPSSANTSAKADQQPRNTATEDTELSLADRVAARVCKTYDNNMKIEEMRNSSHRGPFTEARQIIAYLLMELEQEGSVIRKTVGIPETAKGLAYVHRARIITLMESNGTLRLKVNALRKEFGLPEVNGALKVTAQEPDEPLTAKRLIASAPRPLHSEPSHNGNGSVDLLLSAVSDVVCRPLLLGNGNQVFDLATARIATTFLLFEHARLTPEQIAEECGCDEAEVNRKIVLALTETRRDDSEVSKIMGAAKRRLKFLSLKEPLQEPE